MKMVKKILLGTLALAAVLTFASCGQREEAGTDMIDVNAGSSKASIDYTNEGTDVARNFKTLQNNHLDAIVHVTNKVHTIETPTNAVKCNGVMGYIFNLKKDENDKYSFTIAGLRYNQYANPDKLEAYVETFRDIAGDELESNFPYGTHATAKVGGTTTTWGKDAFGVDLGSVTINDDGEFEVWIDVVANDGESDGRKGTKGTYTVTYYKADPDRKKDGNKLNYATTAEANKLAEFVVSTNDVFHPYSTKLKDMEADIGFYANVTAGQTLTGEWKFDAIKMEAEEIEE